ncbi:CHRD domain-containing protein [Xanthomarina sp. F2636L]|uniref:CHRD domain-containing protein n=1 Tax=Xanthomarina sp. F2636L TaxID=2996018 RepID=UPI00225DF747|nr:CHRD domain-containing protein [Xanthomarina sp. F2636L]MCX7550235.1 CHRD domain-containing protein [Xanthomarina sp. F2636L]
MKNLFKLLIFILPLVVFTGCSGDDHITAIPSSQTSKSYVISSLYDNNVNGVAKFIKNDDNSTTVELKLTGISTGSPHPASINYNTAAEGGLIAVTLNPVNDNTGFSTTTFTALDNGTPITYDEFLSFDGYIDVLLSALEPDSILAQGDIGQNELTGLTKTYNLGEKDVPGMSGIVTFSQRENGEALAVIQVTNATNGNMHPAHIHNNTAVEGGAIALTFNPVDGDTGISATNVAALDNDVAFLYIDVIDFDGYINVHESEVNLATIVAQGDIGQNELSGVSTSYVLNEVDLSGISGTVTFYGRNNGEALAVILLQETPVDGIHPAYIYSNDIDTSGSIIFTFNPVDGNTGVSQTNVSALDDNAVFGYDDVLGVNGHIKVHLNNTLTTIIAQGNIGANN